MGMTLSESQVSEFEIEPSFVRALKRERLGAFVRRCIWSYGFYALLFGLQWMFLDRFVVLDDLIPELRFGVKECQRIRVGLTHELDTARLGQSLEGFKNCGPALLEQVDRRAAYGK